jgi:quercetin dioxygenase-like cupin family protein
MLDREALRQGAVLDLASIDRELREENGYERGGHTARTLVHAPDLRVVFIVMKAGSRIPEHRATESVSIQTVSGHVRFRLQDRTVELSAGQLFSIAPLVQHDVEATVDSAFVLTFGWHAEPE